MRRIRAATTDSRMGRGLRVVVAGLVIGGVSLAAPPASGVQVPSSKATEGPGRTTPGSPWELPPGWVEIAFDEVPEGTVLSTEYRDKGIEFLDDVFTTQDSSSPSSPVLSGIPLFGGRVSGRFVRPDGTARVVNAIHLDIGNIDEARTIGVALYGVGGERLTTRNVRGTGIVSVELESSVIASFTVFQRTDDPGGFAIDNLAYFDGTSQETYVALGDSFSSGEGTRPFDEETFPSVRRGCHRSEDGWPRLVSDQLDDTEIIGYIACSGAVVANIVSERKFGEAAQSRSLESLPSDPTTVTITIGGNDVGFSDVLASCFLVGGTSCEDALDEAMSEMVTTLPPRLHEAYAAIQEAAPASRVVVVGYPGLMNERSFEEAGTECGWVHREGETAWAKFQVAADLMDSTVAATAAAHGLQYISVRSALAGHELCTPDSWLNRLRIPVSIPPTNTLLGHPNLQGQQALAAVVAGQL